MQGGKGTKCEFNAELWERLSALGQQPKCLWINKDQVFEKLPVALRSQIQSHKIPETSGRFHGVDTQKTGVAPNLEGTEPRGDPYSPHASLHIGGG